MANRVGPTIWAELRAAAVPLDGFTIDLVSGAPTFDPGLDAGTVARVEAVIAAHDPGAARQAAPDGPTLSDWRVGLTLWGRIDDVTARVAALAASTKSAEAMTGRIARERLEYANTVLRAQLMQLKDALGFTGADVDESLWRADRVRLGDLSGTWPPPAAT